MARIRLGASGGGTLKQLLRVLGGNCRGLYERATHPDTCRGQGANTNEMDEGVESFKERAVGTPAHSRAEETT